MQPDSPTAPVRGVPTHGLIVRRLLVTLATFACIASTASAELMLYWTDKGTDQKKIYRGAFDGSTMEVVAEVQPYSETIENMSLDLRGLTVDDVNGTVYFNTQYRDMCCVDLDGENLERIIKFENTYGNKCREMAVDPENDLVYWANFTGTICRSDPDFTNIEVLTDGEYPRIIGLDLDLSAGKMYWSSVVTAGEADGAIYRADLDGGNVETLVTGLLTPRGLGLDVEGGKMYWVDGNTTDVFDGVVQCADLDGGNVQTLVTLEDEVTGLAVCHEAGKVFWTDLGIDAIRACNLDGSGVTTLFQYTNGAPQFLAIGPDSVSQGDTLEGDLNDDGAVNSGDLDMVRGSWGETVAAGTSGDANDDGVVNSGDLDIVRSNWGRTASASAVPEPTMCVLFLFGLLAVGLRRS